MMISWMLIAAVLIAFIGFWLGRAANAAHYPTPGTAGSPEHSPDSPYPAAARRRFPLARWLAVAAIACGALFFVRTQHVQVRHASAIREQQLARLEAQRAAAARTQSADWDGQVVIVGATPPNAPTPPQPSHDWTAVPEPPPYATYVQSTRITIVGLIILPVALVIALWLLGPWKAIVALLALFVLVSMFWGLSYVEPMPAVEQLSQQGNRFPHLDGQFPGRAGHDARSTQRFDADAGVRQAVEEVFGHLWQRPEPVIALDTAPVGERAPSDAASEPNPAVVAAAPAPEESATDADAAGEAAAEPQAAAIAAADASGAATAAQPGAASPGAAEGAAETAAVPADSSSAPAAARPAWVDQPPRLVGRVDQRVISAGPYLTLEECVPDLQQAAERAVRDLLRERRQRNDLPFDLAGEPPQLSDLRLGLDSLLESYCTERYCETLKTSFGQMQQVHALLEFSDAAQLELLHRWRTVLQRERQQRAAAAAGFTVLGVGLAYALLQLDARTHGYYTKRLFLGVPAAIIAALALLTRLA